MIGKYRVPSTEYRVLGARSAVDELACDTQLRLRTVLGTRHSVLGTVFILSLLTITRLPAQTQLADSLWAAGNYRGAKVEYTLVLHQDPGSVRALYRLAILSAWDGRLDSALALLRDAREVLPSDPDVRVWEAKVIQWQGYYRDALARYDSVIVEYPERLDARLGRAQTLAWWGRTPQADREYRALAEAHPNDAEAQIAFAQLLLWQQQLREADRYVARALRVAPEDRTGRDLRAQISALRRPRVELTVGASHDSDNNNAWWQTLGTTLVPGPGIRAFATAEAYQASDASRSGNRVSAEVGGNWNHGNLGVVAAVGVRRLTSDFSGDRSLGTVRMGVSYRLNPGAGLGVGYAHYSFDETALLLGSGLDVDEYSAEGDVDFRPGLSLGMGVGTAGFSDGNHRPSLVVALTQKIGSRLSLALFGRGLWYDFRGIGYFSPDRFLIGEIRAKYTRAFRPWEARLSGGVGLQDIGVGGQNAVDGKWHVEARLARRWSTINEIALSGGYSNSAISSPSGAYGYYTATLTARIGL
jgi:tetratricopeptide (TPR) repeat protein